MMDVSFFPTVQDHGQRFPVADDVMVDPLDVKATEKKIAEIVDTINLAIITGGFIGIILLNIYSRIAQYF